MVGTVFLASDVRGLLWGHSSTEQVAREREDVRAVETSRLTLPTVGMKESALICKAYDL